WGFGPPWQERRHCFAGESPICSVRFDAEKPLYSVNQAMPGQPLPLTGRLPNGAFQVRARRCRDGRGEPVERERWDLALPAWRWFESPLSRGSQITKGV